MIIYVGVCLTALILVVSALHPLIRNRGLYLPGAVTAAFSCYLTYSAILSQPKSVIRGLPIEFQAVQFFNLRHLNNRSESHLLATNRTGSIITNTCLPVFVQQPSALDHISDLFAIFGIIFVVGSSIVSSLRATLQAKRLGIQTRRQKMKAIVQKLLAELKEEQEMRRMEGERSNPNTNSHGSPRPSAPSQTYVCFSTERRAKRRRMALEMLKEVADAANASEPEAFCSETDHSLTKTMEESLRQKPSRKKIVLPSPCAAAKLSPAPQRVVEIVAMAKINPLHVSTTPPLFTLNRRVITSVVGKGRPLSVCEVSPSSPPYDLKDYLSMDDVRLQKARHVTQYLAGDEGSHLLHENMKMVDSLVSFTDVLLPKLSPRDLYTVYNEAILTIYSYAWFHFIFCLASLYMMAQLTNWYNPELSSLQTVMESWANMWMKLFSAVVALLLYLLTLCFAPLYFHRRFIQTPASPPTCLMTQRPEDSQSDHKQEPKKSSPTTV